MDLIHVLKDGQQTVFQTPYGIWDICTEVAAMTQESGETWVKPSRLAAEDQAG